MARNTIQYDNPAEFFACDPAKIHANATPDIDGTTVMFGKTPMYPFKVELTCTRDGGCLDSNGATMTTSLHEKDAPCAERQAKNSKYSQCTLCLIEKK